MKRSHRILFGLLIFSNLTTLTLFYLAEREHQRLHQVELQQITYRNAAQQDTNLLCQVNRNLESILSMQLQWKGDWEASTKRICQ